MIWETKVAAISKVGCVQEASHWQTARARADAGWRQMSNHAEGKRGTDFHERRTWSSKNLRLCTPPLLAGFSLSSAIAQVRRGISVLGLTRQLEASRRRGMIMTDAGECAPKTIGSDPEPTGRSKNPSLAARPETHLGSRRQWRRRLRVRARPRSFRP